MKSLRFALIALICSAASAFAQTATLASDATTLSPSGGTVTLTATVSYDGEPGALGWAIVLPADWSLVSVAGPDAPAIAPDAGTTGTLEFAFTSVPAQRAEFKVTVKYPANAATATATSTVLVRANGKLTTVKPTPLQFAGASASRN